MQIPDWPDAALALIPSPEDSRKVRIYASDPTILEAYLILSAFSKTGSKLKLLRENEDIDHFEISNDQKTEVLLQRFLDIIYSKSLNSLMILDEKQNFVYFDWDDRYFILCGSNEFLSTCHPMPLRVGKMYFDTMILDSPDKDTLLRLWELLAPHM